MFAVGAMKGGGHEVPTDRVEAQRWFAVAAERGHAYAQMMFGRYLARGLAGERNPDRARYWLERAVGPGPAGSQERSGRPPRCRPSHPRAASRRAVTETVRRIKDQ